MARKRQRDERRVWTLVANPNLYDIEGAISGLEQDWWDRHGSDIQQGDGIVIWRTQADAEKHRGIFALGEIVGGPESRSDLANPYHRDRATASRVASRVAVRYIPIEEPLWIGGRYDRLVSALSASRGRQTVFKVEPAQWEALSEVLPIPTHLQTNLVSADEPRNPTWSRDELILALDLYVRHQGNPPGKASPEVTALSSLLNQIGADLGANADFRNANGVYMKVMNFRRFDPEYFESGRVGLQRGGKDEAIVWDVYANDPAHLRATADAIRGLAGSSEAGTAENTPAVPEGLQEAEEGRLLTVQHVVRERSRKLVETKKKSVVDAGGALSCEACGFDYGLAYGDHGQGYIEAHHVQPLHSLKPGGKTKLSDLALVCANCHRMIHAKPRWLTMEELRSILEESLRGVAQ